MKRKVSGQGSCQRACEQDGRRWGGELQEWRRKREEMEGEWEQLSPPAQGLETRGKIGARRKKEEEEEVGLEEEKGSEQKRAV